MSFETSSHKANAGQTNYTNVASKGGHVPGEERPSLSMKDIEARGRSMYKISDKEDRADNKLSRSFDKGQTKKLDSPNLEFEETEANQSFDELLQEHEPQVEEKQKKAPVKLEKKKESGGIIGFFSSLCSTNKKEIQQEEKTEVVNRTGKKSTMANSKTNSIRIKMGSSKHSMKKTEAQLEEEKRIKEMKKEKQAEYKDQ